MIWTHNENELTYTKQKATELKIKENDQLGDLEPDRRLS